MNLLAVAFLLLFQNQAPPSPSAKFTAGDKYASEVTHQRNREVSSGNPIVLVNERYWCFQESAPAHTQEKPDTYDPRGDSLYRRYLLATIVGVCGGIIGIGVLVWQTVLARKSANAAKNSSNALVNAERSWVMTEIKWTADYLTNDRTLATRIKETIGTDSNGSQSTSLDIMLIATNEGKCPAWITQVSLWLELTEILPGTPSASNPTRTYLGPEPVSVNKHVPLHFIPSCSGVRTGVGGIPLTLYAVVFYRDAFGEGHETWCGYMVRGSPSNPRLERLAGYPEYNKNK